MGARELGALCEQARQERGWSLARMAYEIGLVPPDDRALNESQAKRILEGRRGLDQWMVARLIQVFGLDEADGWAASGITPPGFEAHHFRRLQFFATTTTDTDALTHRLGKPQGRVKRMGVLLPFPLPALELGRVA